MKHNWEYKDWGEVLTIVNGKNQKAVENPNGTYPIYGSGGIMSYADDYLCPENTVIIGRKGSINNPIYVETKFWNVDTAFGIVANDSLLQSKFLYYFCVFYDFMKHNKATTLPSLVKSDLLKIQMPVPPMAVQERIVAELDEINGMIEAKREQLKQLDLLAQSIFYTMFGDPVTNPKGWRMNTLKSVCSHIVDCPHSTPIKSEILTDYPCIRTSELTDSGIKWDSMQYLTKDEYEKRTQRLKPQFGDIVFGREGTIGGCAMIPKEKYFSLGQRTMLFRPSTVSPTFLLATFRSKWIRNQTELKIVGQTVKHLNIKDLVEFKVPFPPLDLQEQFAAKIEANERRKADIETTIKELQILLDSRMDYWFN